jgi:hypothetical protein
MNTLMLSIELVLNNVKTSFYALGKLGGPPWKESETLSIHCLVYSMLIFVCVGERYSNFVIYTSNYTLLTYISFK